MIKVPLFRYLSVLGIISLVCASCEQSASQAGRDASVKQQKEAAAVPETPEKQPSALDDKVDDESDDRDESDTDDNDETHTDENSARPIFLVGGAAPSLFKATTSMQTFKNLLVAAGKPAKLIHEVDYNNDLSSNLAEYRSSLSSSLKQVLAKYPDNQKFDIVGHSMGHFAALDAVTSMGIANRVKKFIGIAGVANGQKKKPSTCGLFSKCGDAFDKLVPYKSAFVLNIFSDFKSEIENMEKCSVFSPSDGMIDPYDAGRFTDGTNIEIAGISHLKMISTKSVVEQLKKKCFGGKW